MTIPVINSSLSISVRRVTFEHLVVARAGPINDAAREGRSRMRSEAGIRTTKRNPTKIGLLSTLKPVPELSRKFPSTWKKRIIAGMRQQIAPAIVIVKLSLSVKTIIRSSQLSVNVEH